MAKRIVTRQLTSVSRGQTNVMASLLLQSELFDDEIRSNIKGNDEILDIKDLVKAFKNNDETLEKLLCSESRDRNK